MIIGSTRKPLSPKKRSKMLDALEDIREKVYDTLGRKRTIDTGLKDGKLSNFPSFSSLTNLIFY